MAYTVKCWLCGWDTNYPPSRLWAWRKLLYHAQDDHPDDWRLQEAVQDRLSEEEANSENEYRLLFDQLLVELHRQAG